MVGTTGFEPATSRTPSVRATRLRYVPTGYSYIASVSLAFEKGQDRAQFFAQIEEEFLMHASAGFLANRRNHRATGGRLGGISGIHFGKTPARAGDLEPSS